MSEPALRLLDRDLPRVDMYSPDFRRRVLAVRKRVADDAAKAVRQEEIAQRKARREQLRREEIAKAIKAVADYEMTVNQARHFIADREHEAQIDVEGVPDEPRIPAINIIKDVATKYGLTVDIIRGQSRSVPVVKVRHEAMAKVHMARPDLSLPALGRIFNRDHTSILFALRKMGARK